MSRSVFTSSLVTLVAVSTLALAQTHQGHGNHSAAPAKAADTASTKAFKAANATMHKGMDIAYTGNADVDFVRGMIPHHQGAVEMARIVLAHGKDPELKKLAEGIIAAQDKEIIFMNEWLKKNVK